jgi:hypothetical protein
MENDVKDELHELSSRRADLQWRVAIVQVCVYV